jgi:nucleotide-binding universal stress UspA family protein
VYFDFWVMPFIEIKECAQAPILEYQLGTDMKKILCLTDLSEKAQRGIRFANQLARRQSATLIFMHTYKTVCDTKRGLHPALYEYSDSQCREALFRLCLDLKREDPEGGINYEFLVREGTVAQNLNDVIRHYQIDLVVLSVEGQLTSDHPHYSSILRYMVQEAECPVLVIPDSCEYEEIHEIVYALELDQQVAINPAAIEFANEFKAHLRLVTFVNDTGDKNSDTLFGRFKNISNNTGYHRLAFEIQHSDDLLNGLNRYCQQHKAQLVVMENRFRSAFEKVNNPSFTGTFLYHAKLPVLVCKQQPAKAS